MYELLSNLNDFDAMSVIIGIAATIASLIATVTVIKSK